MVALNVLSLVIYAVEWNKTGAVVTSSGEQAQGFHEFPAIIAFLGYFHQVFFNQRNGRHPMIGYISMLASVFCIAMATRNLKSGCITSLDWVSKLPIQNEALKLSVLVWNEAVNIHQFLLYGPLLLHQLWNGYHYIIAKDIKQHALHMRSTTLFLLGPLFQRFAFNHLTARRAEDGVIF